VVRQLSQCRWISVGNEIDLLFVIDNSPSMAGMSDHLGAHLDALIETLADRLYGMPDAHIGVISTDLGTGSALVSGCTAAGDEGRLQSQPRGDCQPPGGSFIDVTNYDGVIRGNVPDANGSGDIEISDIQAALRCIGLLGTDGCGYEQPLEAALRALTCGDQECPNPGFLRDYSLLVVVFITNEDDCSASDDSVFDPDLPTEGGCRCFELGVTCDDEGCAPDEESDSVHPVQRYQDFFTTILPPNRVLFRAITGPSPVGSTVQTDTDPQGNCVLAPTCTAGARVGFPAVRLGDFVRRFERYSTDMLSDHDGVGVCGDDFTPALRVLGHDHHWPGPGCVTEPLIRPDTGGYIEHPGGAECVGTEYNAGAPRDLPRCVFEGSEPPTCPDWIDGESLPSVEEAPCWYLCDAGEDCGYRWFFGTCREPTCATAVAPPPDTRVCLACLTCEPGARDCPCGDGVCDPEIGETKATCGADCWN